MKRAILGMIVAGVAGIGFAHAQDADAGKRVFARCLSCHKVGPGAANGVGPELNGLIGRPAASVEGFEYSDAMKEAGAAGLVWTEADLTAFLTKPQDKVAGTKMAFPGLPREADVANVIAYLAQYDAAGEMAQ